MVDLTNPFSSIGAPTQINADAINSNNTPLSPEDEQKFQDWAATKWGPSGSDPSRTLSDVISNYDMRGFWQSNGSQADNGHYPDTYKKPNHPTFSTDSKYSTDDQKGGEWTEVSKDKWQFVPGPENLKNYTPQQLQDYMDQVDPDVDLKLPKTDAQAFFPNSDMSP